MQKLFGRILGTDHRSEYTGENNRVLRGVKSTQNSGNSAIGGPFRRLDENLVQVQVHPPSNSTWVSATTPAEREVQMNAIHVKRDVELDRRVEEV